MNVFGVYESNILEEKSLFEVGLPFQREFKNNVSDRMTSMELRKDANFTIYLKSHRVDYAEAREGRKDDQLVEKQRLCLITAEPEGTETAPGHVTHIMH